MAPKCTIGYDHCQHKEKQDGADICTTEYPERCKYAAATESPTPLGQTEFAGYANLAEAYDDGWEIKATSCGCGANWAWVKHTDRGTFKMFGCVCHHEPEKDFA